ncbi:MAG: phosphatidate cytidylyltransferase [Methylophilaceae bacterium]|nr:phosphatidate cytidylyltransferase [Methylophilaceae bacterium]
MLKTRFISALSMLMILFLSFFVFDTWFFIVFTSIVSLTAIYELSLLLKLKFNQKIILWLVSLTTSIYFYFFNADNVNIILFTSLFFWILFPVFHLCKKFHLPNNLKIILPTILIVPLWISVVSLFLNNKLFLLFIFVSIFIADIGGYVFGKKYGKNKLIPDVSPGKTIEGVLGAFFLNSIFACLLSFYVSVDLLFILVGTILITFTSIFGDLYESLLKRQSGKKDSGSIIPGHGGILDRIDGFCPTIPISALILNYSYIFGVIL